MCFLGGDDTNVILMYCPETLSCDVIVIANFVIFVKVAMDQSVVKRE
jgi:hypothetical protein